MNKRILKTEHQEQSNLFAWARRYAPIVKQLAMMFAIPNGGKADKMQKIWAWQEGQEAGVPDIFLAVPRNNGADIYGGLFIEMKTAKGVVADNQKEWHVMLEAMGYRVEVCRSSEQAQKTILDYLMYQKGIDSKSFSNEIIEKVLYNSEVSSKNNGVVISINSEDKI